MFKDISTVYKKEIKSILKDKAVLCMCVLLPFMIMFMEGFIMKNMADTEDKEKVHDAYYINAPQDLIAGLKEIGFSDEKVDKDACIADIKNKDAELLVIFPEDFAIDPEGKNLSNIEVYYNSSDMQSLQMREKFSTLLDALRPVVFTVNADTSITYDQGDETYQSKSIIASMVPGLLIMTIVYGILSLASNIIAGDKESNFLNTVLITPVSRTSVAIGKALAVMTAALISAISSSVGLVYLMNTFQEMMASNAVHYSVMDYVLVFVIILSVTFALVGLLLIMSTLAKTARSAQTLAAIPVIILFLGSMLSSNAGMEKILASLGSKNCLIPMWNATYLTKEILLNGVPMSQILITCAVNVVFGILCLIIVSRLFNNEKIVNE